MAVVAHGDPISVGRPVLGLHLLRKLYVQVLIAVVAGAITGFLYPHVAADLKPFGDGFVKAIRVVVTPVIFTTVVVGIATMADIGRIARVGLKALVYFEAMSTLALIIGLIVGNLWPVGINIHADPATLDAHAVAGYVSGAAHLTVTDFVLNIIPSTFIDPFAKGGVLPVAALTLILGVDRFMAEIRAATNLTGNIVATLVVGRWVQAIDPVQASRLMSADGPATAGRP
jgi:Na+/H+-dicarboxylate symporter